MVKTGASESILCECPDCRTAFCCAKTKHVKGFSCRYCKNYRHETSVLFVSEDSTKNMNSNTDTLYGGTDASAFVKINPYSNNNKEYCKMDVDNIKLTNMDSEPHTSVEINDFEEYAAISETNYEDDRQSCADSAHSGQPLSSNMAAQLSAQIMDLPLKDFKETISGEQIGTYKVFDILRRLKEAYDSCTCKICECIAGKPDHSQSQPCNCKVCVNSRRDVLDGVKNTSCSCQPCECINCTKLNMPVPCDCEPCQCMVCKGMAGRRDKTVIVAPVRQGSQRANCLCAPCDCPRCRQRTLNMSLSRVHEMSTGINRHPNCHCEVCIDDSCQPNGTDACSCQIRRHGVIRKPVEKNPHDFDIRRTMVLNNPIKTGEKSASIRTISTYSAFENKNYLSYNGAKVSTSECDCSMCECIACDYKVHPTNSKTLLDKSLRPLKLPCMDFKACNCSPCECLRCIHKKYECYKESEQLKSCSCNICDCLNCEGATKPGNALSSIIPVVERLSNKFEAALQCNDCWKLEHDNDVCHCDLCRCIKSTDKGDVSEEGLYPIKKGELLTPSRMRTDPISALELLSPSSEYTQLKHSKGQSNVFKRETKVSGKTNPKFTVLNLVPRQRTKKLSLAQSSLYKSGLVEDKLDSSDNILCVELPQVNTVTYVSQCNRASTSKTLSVHTIVKTTDNVNSHHKSKIESDETACLYDSTRSKKGCEYQNSPSTSASSSKHVFQHPAPSTSIIKNNAYHQRPLLKKKIDQANGPLEAKKEASSKEVSFVPCNNGEQHGGALHYRYGRQAKTYIYTALPSSNFNAEENADVSEEPPFNKDDYTLENRFYWKLDHSCNRSSENTVDYQLLNNETYKTALTTLEKSRNFSLELVKLLEQYETANSEFESISQKLKESQDLVFDDFELCSRTCRGINSTIKAIGFVSLAQNNKNKIPNTVDSSSSTFVRKKSITRPEQMPLKIKSTTVILDSKAISQAENVSDSSSSTFVRKKSITHPEETALKIKSSTDILDSKTISQAENVSAEICEQSEQIDNRIYSLTESYNSSTTGLICLIDAALTVKNDLQSLSNHFIGTKEVKLFQFNTPYADKNTEDLTLLIKANMKPKVQKIQNSLNEYLINIHKGIKGTTPRIISRVITNLETTELDTKLEEESIPKLYLIQNGEAFTPVQISSDIDQKSSSYCNTQALEILPSGVKDLLKIPKLQQTSRKDCSFVTHIPKVIQLNDDWRFTNPLEMTCRVKSVAKDAIGTNSERKVQFSSLRRVSDHSVFIQWKTPDYVKDIKGYEILVDGRAAQKILSPARCMAVVTCLPRSEAVLLTIRTLTNNQGSGGLPSASISYRPRAKSIKKLVAL